MASEFSRADVAAMAVGLPCWFVGLIWFVWFGMMDGNVWHAACGGALFVFGVLMLLVFGPRQPKEDQRG